MAKDRKGDPDATVVAANPLDADLPVPSEWVEPGKAEPEAVEKSAPAAPAEEKAPEPELPTMTVDYFSQRSLAKSPITIAFVSGEKRVHGVRKLAEPAWRELYDAFLSQAR